MLTIQVLDARTSQPVACRVHVKLADGSCWTPPESANAVYTETDAPDLLLPSHFKRALHICQDADIRSIHLNHGRAALDLPPGPATIYLARGHEFAPIVDRVVIGAAAMIKTYRLERLVDMPAVSWYGGDMHVHVTRCEPADDYVWLRLMEAEDLHALHSLVYKHDGAVIQAPQYAVGARSERQRNGRVLVSGEEFRDGDLYGHMIMAGIDEVVEPISVGPKLALGDDYPLFATACDDAHRRGGIVGWAHGGGVFNRLYESLPIEAALGKLDFVEVVQFNMFYGFRFWRDLLSCGIKLAAVGGSDFPFGAGMIAPWYPNIGLDRTYAQIDGEFSFRAWIEAIRAGRCFATNGPLLFMTVNGQPLGSELHLDGPEAEVEVDARAVCNYALGELDVLCNGAPVARIEGGAGRRELAFSGRVKLAQSSWLGACVRGEVSPHAHGAVRPWKLHAHASSVYVQLDRKPIRVPSACLAMADYVRLCEARYLGLGFQAGGRFSSQEQVDELLGNLRRAVEFYERGVG